MDKAFRNVLVRYNHRLLEERKQLAAEPNLLTESPSKFLLAIGEPTARFLHALIVARGAKRILELGTSYGYSTLFFAHAARQIGGKVISIDRRPAKQDYAKEQLHEAGLDDFVEFQTGDALEIVEKLDGPFDFVLLDIWKPYYVPCLNLLRPRLAYNAVLAADNMLKPEISRKQAEEYRAAVRATREFQTILLPIGQGVELSCVWRKTETTE